MATEEEVNDDDKRMTFKMAPARLEEDELDGGALSEDEPTIKRSRSLADETNNDLKGPLMSQTFHKRQGSMSSMQ